MASLGKLSKALSMTPFAATPVAATLIAATLVAATLVAAGCKRSPPSAAASAETRSALAAATTTAPASGASSGVDTAAGHAVPCGLPAELVARGWPRELTPTSPTRREPAAGNSGSENPTSVKHRRANPKTAFTLGVLPDTQYYTLCRNRHFAKQAQWLASEADALSLAAAIHLGDITESNTPEDWAFAQAALAPLLAKVPTFLATGNHDYGDGGTANRRYTLFANYFSNPPLPTRQVVSEMLSPTSLENAYYRVAVGGGSGGKATLGVLVLGWSPPAAAVEWARAVLTKYPTDRVVFVTHAYLYHDSTRYDWATKGQAQEWNPHAYGQPRRADKQPGDVFDGEKLWRALITQHDNVFLTLSGHVLGDGTGLLTSRTPRGTVVHQVLANYQGLNEGGLGYLRLLEFDTNGRTLRVRTYSPSLDLWATAPDQQFDLDVSPPLW